MTFTDDDLKRWKNYLSQTPEAMLNLPMVRDELALIARLEAAEKLCVMFRDMSGWLCPKCNGEDGRHSEKCEYLKLEKAWCKAAGK